MLEGPRERPHVVWLGGAGCDGCTTAALGAAEPSLEDLRLGRVPHSPRVTLIHPAFVLESGDAYRAWLEAAICGERGVCPRAGRAPCWTRPLAGEGSFSRMRREGDQPVTVATWVDRLAPRAEAVVAIGSCATWGGVPAAAGSRTGAMGWRCHTAFVPGWAVGAMPAEFRFEAFRWQPEPVERALASWPRAPYWPGMRCLWRTRPYQTCGVPRPAAACAEHGRRPSPGETSPNLQSEYYTFLDMEKLIVYMITRFTPWGLVSPESEGNGDEYHALASAWSGVGSLVFLQRGQ
jgi:hypothetical protein